MAYYEQLVGAESSNDIEELCKLFKTSKQHLRISHQNLPKRVKNLLSCKPVRSWSGVVVITVVMRPDKFSCPHDCHYCPNEPGQPRSYLSSEPAVARANSVDFDPFMQVTKRLNMLENNGHSSIDKLEIIILGGTFSTYPKSYKNEFITSLYYAANSYKSEQRSMQSLGNEKMMNESAKHKIIGITAETRPDSITFRELKQLRSYGITRVQLGVQHTNDDILKLVNRGHDNSSSIKAIEMLKKHCFKVDIHIMPDMPGSNPSEDRLMMYKVLCTPEYSPDYLKIYPCLDVDYSELRKWKTNGDWTPYSETNINELISVIMYAKMRSKYYIRFNRIQRDFPESKDDVLGYKSDTIKTNLRQLVQNEAKKQKIMCKCIRCCEIKQQKVGNKKLSLNTETYYASNGTEHYISVTQCKKRLLHGFVRLRFNSNSVGVGFKCLENCALVRELHVYGFVCVTDSKSEYDSQHRGFGKLLMARAENIAYLNNYDKIAVISGVGVRNYYRKLGYELNSEGEYMIKTLTFINYIKNLLIVLAFYIRNFLKC